MWAGEISKKKKLFELLMDESYYNPPLVVFVESRLGADMLAEAITKTCEVEARSIHGEKSQKERNEILQDFINGEYPIIVATGVLGRGLDLLNVTEVRLASLN